MGLTNTLRLLNRIALIVRPQTQIQGKYVNITTPDYSYHPFSDKQIVVGTDYGGMIMYGHRTQTKGIGVVSLRTSAYLTKEHIKNVDQGQIHGVLARTIYGKQPSQLVEEGFIMGGFSIRNNVFQVNSNSFNIPVDALGTQRVTTFYHDGLRNLSANEQQALRDFLFPQPK